MLLARMVERSALAHRILAICGKPHLYLMYYMQRALVNWEK